MTVCAFFQRGHCKYGDSCRYEHPRDTATTTFGNKSWTAPNTTTVSLFTADSIGKDLTQTVDKPLWPLSSYGPAKHEPNLISGLDESPEELRVRAFVAAQTGAINDYLKYETERTAQANQTYADARSRVPQAFEQAARQSNVLSSATTARNPSTVASTSTSVFGSSNTASAFAKPSAFSALANAPTTSAFGGATFGSSTGTSAFGSTSTFGRSAFGQPNFGQSSAPTGSSAFAQPTSAFAQPQSTSAFGQVSQPQSSFIKPASGAFGSGTGSTSAFGQPSFGAPAPQSAFSGAAATGTSGSAGGFSAFAGQPSAFGLNAAATANRPVFGQSSFSATPNVPPPAFGAVPFGSPPSYQDATSTSTPAPAPSAFSALSQQPAGPVSAFGGSTFTLNPTPNPSAASFGTTSAPSDTTSVFATTQPSAFSTAQPRSVFASSSTGEAPRPVSVFGSLSQNPTTAPSAFASGSRNQNEPSDLAAKRATWDKYDALLPDNYLQILPATVREAFEGEKFVWGKIPEWIPPKELR